MVDFLGTRLSTFDDLVAKKGIERGNTILVSGGCGTGKTVFSMQILYNAALEGETGIYISLVEEPEKLRRHMKYLGKGQIRRRALEILKLRCSDHIKELAPYMITGDGISILPGDKVF